MNCSFVSQHFSFLLRQKLNSLAHGIFSTKGYCILESNLDAEPPSCSGIWANLNRASDSEHFTRKVFGILVSLSSFVFIILIFFHALLAL